MQSNEFTSAIVHVFVVGFHHKKGCQVEYCYPSLQCSHAEDITSEVVLPEPWAHLPSLALPDGAHNSLKDTVFFHLPALTASGKTLYGVSCYRQIATSDLVKKANDVTRSSVQKSVCVLSHIPLYGLIKAKLELITQAYFNERDFEKVEVLAELYNNLNNIIKEELVPTQALLGLSARDLVLHEKQRVLILFKLMLLEKRVLFHMAPVENLCTSLLTLVSFFPKMIEHGLYESSPYIPPPVFENDCSVDADHVPSQNAENPRRTDVGEESKTPDLSQSDELIQAVEDALNDKFWTSDVPPPEEADDAGNTSTDTLAGTIPLVEEPVVVSSQEPKVRHSLDTTFSKFKKTLKQAVSSSDKGSSGSPSKSSSTSSLHRLGANESPRKIENGIQAIQEKSYSTLDTDEYGFPLSIFTKGALLHPYLSLADMDLLSSVRVRSYVFGATNNLFLQRKHLLDVAVSQDDETAATTIDIFDSDLRRQLTLTTADLRFTEYLISNVSERTGNVFMDDTEWEGGDEWIRVQFRTYLMALLATAMEGDTDKEEDFNHHFIKAWKCTHNFRVFSCGHYPAANSMLPGHPFQGQLSVGDVKLKLAHTMQNTDSGRKVAQAVTNTGKFVSQTGKSVGGAFLKAGNAMSSWWSGAVTGDTPASDN